MCFRIDFFSRDNNTCNMLIMTMSKVSEQSHEHRHNCFLHFKCFLLVLCSDLQIKPRVLGVTGFITADKGGDVTLECFFSGKWVPFWSFLYFNIIEVSSVQNTVYALRKAHMRSSPPLRSYRNVAFETVPMSV